MAVHRLQGQSSAVTQRSQFTAKSLFHPSPKVTTDQRVTDSKCRDEGTAGQSEGLEIMPLKPPIQQDKMSHQNSLMY